MRKTLKFLIASGACLMMAGMSQMNAQAAMNLETDAPVAGASVAINNYYASSLNPEKELAEAFASNEALAVARASQTGAAGGTQAAKTVQVAAGSQPEGKQEPEADHAGMENTASGVTQETGKKGAAPVAAQSAQAAPSAAETKGQLKESAGETEAVVRAMSKSIYDNIAISHVTNYVNVRSQASTSSEVVGKIYNNCAATILDTVDGEGGKWYHIQSGSVTGYIKAQYFVTGEEASKIAKEVGTTYAKVTNTSTLRLRETPSLEGKTLDLLSADAEYEVIGEEGDFAKISVDNDLVGYVYKDYITTKVDFKEAVSVTEEQQQKAEEAKLKEEANEAIENLEEVKKKAEEESREATTTAAAKETTKAAKETTKAPETSYSGTIEANPNGSKAQETTAAATKATTKAAETTKATTTAAATKATTKATTASGVGPGGGTSSNNTTSSSGNAVTNATRSAVVAYAKQFLGNPYVYGGTSLTNGADCSGFTMSVFAHFGISTGRNSRDQAAKGKEVAVSAVQPGDLLFYASGNYINHVALYIGNGQVIHASTAKSGIKISPSNYRTPCKAVSFLN